MVVEEDVQRIGRFRLVDVTPACRSPDDLARHLGEYLGQVDERTPPLQAAMRATDSRAGRRAPVGNLYVNRAITGAKVGRQPFGGNRRSGIGAKAGGPDYVLQFAEPRVVTENTVRHGLVVDE